MSKGINEEVIDVEEDVTQIEFEKMVYRNTKPSMETKILEYLKKHRGKHYATNELQRSIFRTTGGGTSQVLHRMALRNQIMNEKCGCGRGVMYWLEK